MYYFGGFDLLVGEDLFDDDHWEEGDSVFEDVCCCGQALGEELGDYLVLDLLQ